MQFTAQQLAVLAAALVPSVAGHGFVTGVKSGGVWYPGFDIQLYYQHPHAPVYGWDTTATDSGFVSPDAFATPDIICHRGGAPAALHIPVVAGSTITVYWTQSWPDGHQGAQKAIPDDEESSLKLTYVPRSRHRLPSPLRRQRLLHRNQNRPQVRQNRRGRSDLPKLLRREPALQEQRELAGHHPRVSQTRRLRPAPRNHRPARRSQPQRRAIVPPMPEPHGERLGLCSD